MQASQKEKKYVPLLLFAALLVLLSGCVSYQLDKAQYNLREHFTNGNYDEAAHLLQKYRKDKVYRSKDRVLMNLEAGTIEHFQGDYNTSIQSFSSAEDEIQTLYTKSISRAVSSLLINDNQLSYDGEDYENIYLNAFKCLDYIQISNINDALVEARRIAFKLENLNIRYKGLIDALSKKDSTGLVDWKAGRTNIQNSAFGHFLSAVLYAKTDHPDDARIEATHFENAVQEQPRYFGGIEPDASLVRKMQDEESFNTLLVGFSGHSPVKYQFDTRFYDAASKTYLKISLPVLRLIPSEVWRIYAVVDDTTQVNLYRIENMDEVAADVYKVKQPVIYGRTVLRALLKSAATHTASHIARKKKKKLLGDIIDIAGVIIGETTEKADLRGWQTMPGQAYVALAKLSPGKHIVRFYYIGRNGSILLTEDKILNVSGGTRLELAESLFAQ
ncbi:MAG TPA: hypothetical protein VKA08_17645 [Balneolales bacterium]|nr:hypothetical protein [Balneolales bacterium]